MKKNSSVTARLKLIGAMTIFGTVGFFVRNIPTSSGQLALSRALIAALLLGLFLLISGKKIPFSRIRKQAVLLLISGAAMGINWILLFEAYKHTTVSVATLGYYFAPVIVTLVCPILFRERLTWLQILCFAASTLGLILITGTGSVSASDTVGILFSLGAAVLYASVVLLNKFIGEVEGLHRTFLQFLAAVAVLLPYVLLTDGTVLPAMNGMGWLNLLTVGLIHTTLTYLMYFSALKDLPGQKAAILSYVDPLVAILLSVTVLGESMSVQQIIGGGLILGFTLLNELSPAMRKKG